jgi:hypothetical protein
MSNGLNQSAGELLSLLLEEQRRTNALLYQLGKRLLAEDVSHLRGSPDGALPAFDLDGGALFPHPGTGQLTRIDRKPVIRRVPVPHVTPRPTDD